MFVIHFALTHYHLWYIFRFWHFN